MSLVKPPLNWSTALLAMFTAAIVAGCAPTAAPKAQSVSQNSVKQPEAEAQPPAGNTEPEVPASAARSGQSAARPKQAATADADGNGPVSGSASGDVTVQSVTPDQFKQLIAAQKGKVVLVDFWATWCTSCREKFPKTLALSKKYADQGLSVVSMSMDTPEPKYQKEVIKFLRQQNARVLNLENSLDDTEAAFNAFAIDGGALPHYKIFDRHGVLRKTFGGDVDRTFDERDIEAAVVAALKAP